MNKNRDEDLNNVIKIHRDNKLKARKYYEYIKQSKSLIVQTFYHEVMDIINSRCVKKNKIKGIEDD